MSKAAVESTEDAFNKSETPWPEPPAWRRRLTLGSLVAVGLAALLVVFLLLPNASYATRSGAPTRLGPLASADLQDPDSWVSASGTPEPEALAFARWGARGSFRLTRLKDRGDVWLLFKVPDGVDGGASDIVPPTHFVGRLLRVEDSSRLPSRVREVIEEKSESFADAFVLIDGETPKSHQPSLVAAVLLALLAAACLSFAVFLWRDVKPPLPQS